MDNIEYYKSLISDEEVIKALIKESKAREGELLREKARVRPNLNFFHRTVTNLVSSNKRVNPTKDLVYNEAKKTAHRSRGKMKTPHTLIKEIVMSNKITCVKSTGSKNGLVEDDSNDSTSITNCGTSMQPSKSTEVVSATEKTYREDLNKYFVCATNHSRSSQSYRSLNSDKSKNIVFNINVNKDNLSRLAKTHEDVLESKKQSLSVRESSDVTNLVASYKRMNTTVIQKPLHKVRGPVKTPRTLIKEIVMSNKKIDRTTRSKTGLELTKELADAEINSALSPFSECEVIEISESESD